jgi:hypothetical protein
MTETDNELKELRAENARLKDMFNALTWANVRYKDRPPGFVEARRKICSTSERSCSVSLGSRSSR